MDIANYIWAAHTKNILVDTALCICDIIIIISSIMCTLVSMSNNTLHGAVITQWHFGVNL